MLFANKAKKMDVVNIQDGTALIFAVGAVSMEFTKQLLNHEQCTVL